MHIMRNLVERVIYCLKKFPFLIEYSKFIGNVFLILLSLSIDRNRLKLVKVDKIQQGLSTGEKKV